MVVYSFAVNEKDLTGGRAVSEGRLRQAMLLDFYGELLTEKQRLCFDLHHAGHGADQCVACHADAEEGQQHLCLPALHQLL